MNKRTLISIILVLFSGFTILNAQTTDNRVVDVIMNGYSSKIFSKKPVTDSEIDKIVQCGMKAPSGMNTQQWRFTVVKDSNLLKEIMPAITSGNIIIVVSTPEPREGTMNTDYGFALATQNMYIAAQGLGLGTHLYAGPIAGINTNFREKLGIPAGYNAAIMLRVGGIEKSVDAVTAASTRKKPEEIVNYK